MRVERACKVDVRTARWVQHEITRVGRGAQERQDQEERTSTRGGLDCLDSGRLHVECGWDERGES